MSVGLHIRPEEHSDEAAIRSMVAVAFKSNAEADLIDRLRREGDLTLSLVGTREKPVGHVAFSPLHLKDAPQLKACALGPLAVLPGHQNSGIGTELIEEALRQLREAGFDLVLVLGEPAYYGRFGFTTEAARALKTPYDGPYLQALHLSAKATGARGAVVYADAFTGLS
ncbi:GNAT family N-acetyltransferase [Microvirga brassicacearum]|uniref:N-acetyltransferase n=1 Tax=Microvirga brassicacearum TaxID=2580413 RepID=A0A5N3PD26_9HYPH|nr:N-acetyltransferase [Microvirga brassicacearum]KAB0267604.1 N-acetyltransferase [Microvirga brassicacearum]